MEEVCLGEDEVQRTRGISELSNETTDSYIMDDDYDIDDNNNNNNNSNNNNNDTTDNNNNISDERLKLTCGEDTNAFYVVDMDLSGLKKVVNEKRNKDELKRKEYMFHEQGYPSKKNNNKWKYLSYILTIVIVLMVFGFLWEFAQIQDIQTKLTMMHSEPKVLPKKAKQTFTRRTIPPNGFTALSLKGNGHQVVHGREGLLGIPINWKMHFHHGAIDFLEGKKIGIKKTGLYHLYAQMFFFKNEQMYNNTKVNPVLDFGITKISSRPVQDPFERVIAATVALSSCKVACTRHISSFVSLEDGDILIVDTATPGVYFKMVQEKTLFGAYFLSDVHSTNDHKLTPILPP